MKVYCQVSIGELLDKISILRIKKGKIIDAKKKQFVGEELETLTEKMGELNLEGAENFLQRLVEVNTQLWEIEDDIRIKEKEKDFGKEFLELARSVYLTNDKRFEIKNEINQKYGSAIREVKSYEKYS